MFFIIEDLEETTMKVLRYVMGYYVPNMSRRKSEFFRVRKMKGSVNSKAVQSPRPTIENWPEENWIAYWPSEFYQVVPKEPTS